MSHGTYYCKELGRELPSVTTILGIIAKGEGFNNWLKKQGDNADKILTEAGDFGTCIHNHLEAIGKGIQVNVDALRPKEKRCVVAFQGWVKDNVKRFISTEQAVYNVREGYAGTLDAVVEMIDGRIAVLDYKTSSGIYDTYELQVVSYGKAWGKFDDAYILRFENDEKKKDDMQIRKVDNHDYLYEVFLAALKVYNWRNNR